MDGIPIIKPRQILSYTFGKIFVSPRKPMHFLPIVKQLIEEIGIEEDKIEVMETSHDYRNVYLDERRRWIKEFAGYAYKNINGGSVAECGVYHGETAMFINEFFPDRRLYLFDTFEGFSDYDIGEELKRGNENYINGSFSKKCFNADSSEDIMETVRKRMLFPEKVELIKGYFPDSAASINDRFAFVNLDMDLYTPMLAGLRFFWDKMLQGGVMLLHDYFHPELPGVAEAVMEFEAEIGKVAKVPIGDGCSIAIIKN